MPEPGEGGPQAGRRVSPALGSAVGCPAKWSSCRWETGKEVLPPCPEREAGPLGGPNTPSPAHFAEEQARARRDEAG